MQPTFKPTELDRYRQAPSPRPAPAHRPQPLEPRRPNRPWVVPLARAGLIVVLLVALVALAAQAPTLDESVFTTTTLFIAP